MGVSAAYMSIDEQTLDRLVSLSPDVLMSTLKAIEADGAPTTHVANMWDGLHFLLTGVSADAPREDDPLSEAVVGVHAFGGEDFVGCTEHDELPTIIEALDGVDLSALLVAADFTRFADADIYPRIWNDDPEQLRAELADAFTEVRAAHRRAFDEGHHLLISIF